MVEQDIAGIRQKAANDLVVPYRAVRRSIGVLGLFLPVALTLYGLFGADGILGSMSAYFYSPMREVFVGTLCALSVFLWTYEGYRAEHGEWLNDRNAARGASLGAAGVALLPTLPAVATGPATCTLAQCLLGDGPASAVHFLSAGLFFGAMAVFCLFLFTRGDDSAPEKRAANRVYRLCGWVIVGAMALIGLLQLTGLGDVLAPIRPVFWLEVLASTAIAVGWMTKGDSLEPLMRMAIRRG